MLQICNSSDGICFVDKSGISICNPFMDLTGRFEYSLGQVCSAYGEENVAAFIEKCQI